MNMICTNEGCDEYLEVKKGPAPDDIAVVCGACGLELEETDQDMPDEWKAVHEPQPEAVNDNSTE